MFFLLVFSFNQEKSDEKVSTNESLFGLWLC